MTYTTNMPLVGQNINVTQPLIEANFNYLNTYLGVDHTQLNGTPIGTHQAIHLERQGTVFPGIDPTTTSSELGFYARNDAANVLRMFMREPSSGTVQQISGNVISPTLTPFAFELPLFGGLILKGAITPVITSSGPPTTFTYASLGLSNFPNRTLNVQMTPTNQNGNVATVSAVTASQITAKANNSSGLFYFIAIGN
jgi:hypothetical protein